MKFFFTFFFVLVVCFQFFSFSADSIAAPGVNRTINFQGKVVNKTAGTNVTNGNYDFTFRLYDAAANGTLLWTENWTGGNQITVTDGIFRANLGSVTTFASAGVDFNSDSLYLDISFNGETMGSRVRMTAVPYALNAEKVSGLTVTNNGGNTLNIAANKTFTVNNSVTFSGTDSTTFTLPTSTDTLVGLSVAQTLTNKTIGSSGLVFSGASTDITTGTNESFTIGPNGSGETVVITDFDSGVMIGSASNTPAVLSVSGNRGANASLIVNQTGLGDLFTASSSGLPKFSISNAGVITLANGETIDNTTDNTIVLGSDDANGAGVVRLPVKTTTGDPSLNSGGNMYYNSADNKFRCYQNGWVDCIPPAPNASTFTDSTTEVTSFTSATDFWDGTYANITPNTSSSKILISVVIRGTSDEANDQNPVFQIWKRSDGSNPGCGGAGNTAVGGEFVGGFLTTGTQDWGAAATFLDTVSSTNNVRYTVCSTTTGADDGNTNEVTISLAEVGSGVTASSGTLTVKETDGTPTVSSATTMEFGPASSSSDEFVVTDEGSGVARIRAGTQIGLLNEAETVTGGWTFDTLATIFSTLLNADGGISTSLTDQNLTLSANGLGNIALASQVTVAQDMDFIPVGTTGINDLGSATVPWDSLYVSGVLPAGASGLVLGGGTMTSLTVTTDGTGDAEVSLPTGSIATAEIFDASLLPVDLDLTTADSANDEDCLTYESSTTDFEWQPCGGGSQTPWTTDIDADGFDLTDLSNLLFRETIGAPAGTDVGLYRDNSGDLNANVLTGKGLNFQVNGTDEYTFTSTAFTLGTNSIVTGAQTIESTELDRLNGKDTNLVDENDLTSGDGAGGTSSGSGLEAGSGGIGLLQGCTDGQILEWNDASAVWQCANDDAGGIQDVVYMSDASNTTWADNNTTELWNAATQPNITPASTGSELLVMATVRISTDPAVNETQPAARIDREIGSTADCADVNTVGPTFGISDSDNAAGDAASIQTATVAFVDAPATTSNVSYTVCTSADSVITGTNTETRIDFTIMEVNDTADLAEIYPTRDTSLHSGEVVTIDPMMGVGVTKSKKANDNNALGVVSTVPALVIGGPNGESGTAVPVALSGRVPVKVTAENGSIKTGDALTTSSIPGVAMRATKAGTMIGIALDDFQDKRVGTIMMFVKTGAFSGASLSTIVSDTHEMGSVTSSSARILNHFLKQKEALESDTDMSEIVSDRIAAGLEVIAPRVVADEVIVRRLKASEIDLPATWIQEALRAGGIEFVVKDEQVALSEVASASTSAALDPVASMSAFPDMLTLQGLTVSGQATVSANLRVKGNSLVEGIATIIDTLITKNLIVNGVSDFFGKIIVRDDIELRGQLAVGNDTAGVAVIKKDTDHVDIQFAKPYDEVPLVTTSIALDTMIDESATDDVKVQQEEAQSRLEEAILSGNIQYVVTRKNKKGFTIKLNRKAPEDIQFAWTTLGVKALRTEQSSIEHVSVTVVPTVLQTVAPTLDTVSITPTVTPYESKTITVLDNELGYLRVRQSPFSSSEEIGRVEPEQAFAVIREENGWFNVAYESGKTGWVSSLYVTVTY